MKKIMLIFLGLLTFGIIYAQELNDDDPEPPPKLRIYAFFGSFADEPSPYLAFQRAQTDSLQSPKFPIIFNVPDPSNPSKNMRIDNYIESYGDYPYLHFLDNREGFLQTALKSYWSAMFKENSDGNISDLEIIIVKPPRGSISRDFWVIPENSDIGLNFSNLSTLVTTTLADTSDEIDLDWSVINDYGLYPKSWTKC